MRNARRFVPALALAVALSGIARAAEPPPAPRPGPVLSGADLRGAYLVVGSKLASEVVRIEAAEWQRSPDGRTTFSRIEGRRPDGRAIVYERRLCGGGVPVTARDAGLVIDENGMVTRPGESAMTWEFTHPCGLTTQRGCEPVTCANCKPDCSCADGSGWCEMRESKWCDGSCDSNRLCNTSVNDCRCEAIAAPVPTTPSEDPGKPDPKAKKVAPR